MKLVIKRTLYTLSIIILLLLLTIALHIRIPIAGYINNYINHKISPIYFETEGVYLSWDVKNYFPVLELKGNKIIFNRDNIYNIEYINLGYRFFSKNEHSIILSIHDRELNTLLPFSNGNLQGHNIYKSLNSIIDNPIIRAFEINFYKEVNIDNKKGKIQLKAYFTHNDSILHLQTTTRFNKKKSILNINIANYGKKSFYISAESKNLQVSLLKILGIDATGVMNFYGDIILSNEGWHNLSFQAQSSNLVIESILKIRWFNPLNIKYFAVNGSYNPYQQTIYFSDFQILSSAIKIMGNLEASPERVHLDCKSFKSFAVNALYESWPISIGGNLRSWLIFHLNRGEIEDSKLNLDLFFDNSKKAKISGIIKLKDSTLQRFIGAPELSNINTDLIFEDNSMKFSLKKAKILNSILKAEGQFNNLFHKTIGFDTNIDLYGSVADAVNIAEKILNRDNETALISNKFKNLGGDSALNIKSSIFIQDSTNNILNIDINGKTKDTSLTFEDYKIDNGAFNINLKNKILNIKGTADYENFKNLRFDYNKSFATKDGGNIAITTLINAKDIKNYKIQEFIKGPVSLTLVKYIDNHNQLSLRFGLEKATVLIPILGIDKKNNEPGSLKIDCLTSSDGCQGKYQIKMGNDWSSAGNLTLDQNNILRNIENSSLNINGNWLHFSLYNQDDTYNLHLNDGVFDLWRVLKQYNADMINAGQNNYNIIIVSKNTNFLLNKNLLIHKPSFNLRYNNKKLNLDFRGDFNKEHNFTIVNNETDMLVATNNAELLISGLGINDNIKKGILKMNCQWSNDTCIGSFVMSDYYLRNAPLLAKILGVASLTFQSFRSIDDLLSNKGLFFSRARGEFIYQNNIINLQKVGIKGSSLAMTAEGSIDLHSKQVSVKGILTPNSIVNSIAQNLPLINKSLNKSGGLIAVNYKISGLYNKDLSVFINPLSVLLPGFIKDLF